MSVKLAWWEAFYHLLTACLTRYRDLRATTVLRNKLLILLGAFLSLTIYQPVPLPSWIGSMLLWNSGSTNRWLFASGFLLILAVILIWNNGLISLHPARLTLFALLGPLISISLKSAWVNIHGMVSLGGFDRPDETLLCVLIFVAALSARYIPVTWRVPVVLTAILLMNVYAFDRFNPVQSAKPIFDVPNTHVVDLLKQEAASDPNGILVEARIFGAVFNGLGYRSVNHVLMSLGSVSSAAISRI